MVTSTLGLSDLWITDEGVSLEDDAQIIVQMRAEVLRPLLLLQSEGQQIGPAVEFAAAQLDVSRSTAWRLLGLLRENDGRASALLPNRSGPKRGSFRLSEQVEDLIDRVLRDRYLVLERPSFRRIVGEIRAECSAKGFQPPSRQTIKARLDAMDQRDVLRKRKRAKAAR